MKEASSIWPLRAGEATWRFGAAGLFSRALMTPILGLLVALVTAAALEHRRFARVLSVFGFLGSLLAIFALGLFGLDTLQTRASVRPEATTAFDTAWIVAAVKYVLGAFVALLLGIGGWKVSRTPAVGEPGAARKAADDRILISAERPEPQP